MRFLLKHYKLLITICVFLSIFVIFKTNNKNNQNYLAIGDGYALGIDCYGQIDYGYSDYVKDFLQDNNYLNKYIKSFSEKDSSILSLYNDIKNNKKIVLNKKEYNLRRELRESTILTINVGLNDLLYLMSTIDNYNTYNINNINKKILTSYNNLIKEIKMYYQYDIYVIGYYNIYPNSTIYTEALSNLNNILQSNKEIIYIDINKLFKNNNYRENSLSIYPNRQGYEAISKEIITKIRKKLEKL